MGHARTYVSFDIMRRLITDYFGYNVQLVMNITDIDDKIIRKAMEEGRNFTEISRKFETEFLDDMRRLNVALPDCITRVSEFTDEIIAFIEKIIENGFAYESNGSVYFNVRKYGQSEGHTYAKLEPTSASNLELLAEGEGVLQQAEPSEKRDPADFALWKKSKEGEPSWSSPWGEGRPGWHIECSAMAASVFQKYPIDVHTGGVDLRFPHHDNEIAQSEAYYGCDNWVKYFYHTGHLHIQGKKMSKSLKNFITIKHILNEYNHRQIRFLFLLHTWSSLMNYTTEKSMPEAVAKERRFTEFFRSVKAATRISNLKETSQKWGEADFQLSEALATCQKNVHEALADSFDTPRAVEALSTLVTHTNNYLQLPAKTQKQPLIRQVSKYVFFILKCFGVYSDDDVPTVLEDSSKQGGQSFEEQISPLMDVLSTYRDKIKLAAKDGAKPIFELSDELRDEILPHLGIKLEDKKPGEPAAWKFVDSETLLKELEAAKQAKLEMQAKKAAADAKKKADAELALQKKQTPGSEYFRVFEADKYT